MPDLVSRHRRACAGFSQVAGFVQPDQWDLPTPCTEWDARGLVEHVIGFHDNLLLRPLGVRANRPRTDPAARWEATRTALFGALDTKGVLDQATELPGGGRSTPRTMLAALTTDVLVHTWDLARAVGQSPALDPELCSAAYAAAHASGIPRDSGMYRAEISVTEDADVTTRLIAFCGRDPSWRSSRGPA